MPINSNGTIQSIIEYEKKIPVVIIQLEKGLSKDGLKKIDFYKIKMTRDMNVRYVK